MKSKRKVSGGRYKKDRKKRKSELKKYAVLAKIGKDKRKVVRVRGGNKKVKLLFGEYVNVFYEKGCKKVKIKSIIENLADRHFVRRGIITKGCVVETEIGKVRITSRPGQTGTLDGVLIE